MSKLPWSCDRELDEARVRTLIFARWPELAACDVRYLAEGWDSQAYEVGGTWIFRFPKRAEVQKDVEVEIALLPELAAHLARAGAGVRIPVCEFVGTPGELFPYVFTGYRKLAGVQACDVDAGAVPPDLIPRQIGGTLSALHAFPTDRALALGVPADMASRHVAVMRDRALHRLPDVAAPLGALATQLRTELERRPPAEFAGDPVLVHNDLLDEHFILHPESRALVGVIDWSDAALGDPAVDLVGVHTWGGPRLVDAVLAHYPRPLDDGARDRVRFRALCLGVYFAYHALATGSPADMRWAIAALERSF